MDGKAVSREVAKLILGYDQVLMIMDVPSGGQVKPTADWWTEH